MAGEIFASTFTNAELIKAATVTITAGEIIRVGEYKVQAGEMISVGSGMLAGMDNATGRVYMQFKDSASALMSGSIRLVAYSAQNRPIEILREYRTEDLDTSATDKTKQIPNPEHYAWLREDQRLVLEFIGDTGGIGNGTLDKSKSKILLAMTKQVL